MYFLYTNLTVNVTKYIFSIKTLNVFEIDHHKPKPTYPVTADQISLQRLKK